MKQKFKPIKNLLWYQLYGQLSVQLVDQLSYQLHGQLMAQLKYQLYNQLCSQLEVQAKEVIRDETKI